MKKTMKRNFLSFISRRLIRPWRKNLGSLSKLTAVRYATALTMLIALTQLPQSQAQDLFYAKGNITVKSSGSVYINGGLKADGSASINNDGIITIANHSTPGGENWTNNVSAAMLSGTGAVVFNSSEPQNIGGSDTTTFNNLTINNTSSTGVTLDTPIIVNSSLTLTDGMLYTDATNLLVLIDNATSSSGSAASFIDGPIKKIGNDAFTFSVGDTAAWARIGISAPLNTTAEFVAEYFDGRHADANNTDGTLNNSSVVEYWTLNRSFGSSPDDDVQVTLYWEDTVRSGIDDGTDLRVARYTGTQWTDEGQAAISYGLAGWVQSNTVSSFSPFTFGSLSSLVNPLPIELLFFDAALLENRTVLVEWITASEINNAYFILEHGNNAMTWQKITTIPGAGSSNEMLYYSFYDEHPYDNHTYYRLKQVDFDGSYEYSDIVVVSKSNFIELISIFPNPFWLNFYIGFNNPNKEAVIHIKISDILGRTYLEEEKIISEGYNEIKLDMTYLPAGLYSIELRLGDLVYNEKMVKFR